MNYLITENYINVKEFVAIGDSYYSIDKNNNLYFNDLEIENGIYGISKQNNLIFAYTLDRENNVTTILLDKNSFIAEINIPLLSNLYYGTTTLFGYDYEPIDSSRKYGVYDLKLNKIVLELKNRYSIGQSVRFGNFVLYRNLAPFIYCLDIDSDSVIWQFAIKEIGKYTDFDAYFNPIEKEGEVRKIIGICGDILLIAISGGFDGKNNVSSQLIGLSCQSGELLWRLDMFDANGIRTHYGSYETLQIDGINNRLLGFNSQGFIEIDIKNGKVKRFNDLIYSEINDKADLYVRGLEFFYKDKILKNVYSETLVGEHLYFKATNTANRRHSLSSNVIGAYNHETETIDWIYEFEDLAPSVSIKESPKVEGNRLYALDSSGTLHIFERDLS